MNTDTNQDALKEVADQDPISSQDIPNIDQPSESKTPVVEGDSDVLESQSVPYSRFKEVLDEKKELEKKTTEYEQLIPYAQYGYALLEKLNSDTEFKDDYEKAINKLNSNKALTAKDKQVLSEGKELQEGELVTTNRENPTNVKQYSPEEFEKKVLDIAEKRELVKVQNREIDDFFTEFPDLQPSSDSQKRAKQAEYSSVLFSTADYLYKQSDEYRLRKHEGLTKEAVPSKYLKQAHLQLSGKSIDEAKEEGKLEGMQTVLSQQQGAVTIGSSKSSQNISGVKITDEIRKIAQKTGKTPEKIAHLVSKGLLRV